MPDLLSQIKQKSQNQFTHPWTNEELKFLELNLNKLTYKEMSLIINRTPTSIQTKITHLPFQKKIKKHSVNSNFFKTWSPEMAYVLGFIGADGNICHSGRAHTLHIASDDIDIIEKIKIVLAYEGPIHWKFRNNGKISFSLRICDPIIFHDLEILGITERKSLTLIPPPTPKELIHHFIRGYFAGDGSVSIRNKKYPNRISSSFYTASLAMATYIHKIIVTELDELYQGKIFTKIAHSKTLYYSIHIGHQASIKLSKYMYRNTNLYLARKHAKFIMEAKYEP